jgi:hypothetical protein
MAVTIAIIPMITGRALSNVIADGLATTLNGSTLVGAATATLTSATGFTNGTIVVIDTGNLSEVALIKSIAGAVVTFADPLTIAHASGVAFSRAIVPQAPAESAPMVRSPYLQGG